MELETKHLAPYLPYKLMCEVKDLGKTIIAEMHSVYSDGTCTFCDTVESEKGFDYVKPVLIPLKEFENFESVTDEMLEIEIENLKNLILLGVPPVGGYVENLCVSAYNQMLANHIDVFGLISKGLAVYSNVK